MCQMLCYKKEIQDYLVLLENFRLMHYFKSIQLKLLDLFKIC